MSSPSSSRIPTAGVDAGRGRLVLGVLLTQWPALVFGQAPAAPKAGVVSTLQGTVTATRTGLPQPLALKFKDEVFLQDRIATGEQSIARILLGGKALITIRERSALTITEIPGRSTVDLESGKIGLAVARERMRPGEVVDIRTSNAVAAVRGTVLIAEVERRSAQTTPGGFTQVVSNFYVLRDQTNRGVEITQLVTGTRTTVLPGQGFSILGAAAGRTVPIPSTATAGLQTTPGSQHTSGSTDAQLGVAAGQTQQAVALTTTILGDPGSIPGTSAPITTTTPTTTSNSNTCTGLDCITIPPTPPPPPPSACPPACSGAITGTTFLSLPPGEHLEINQPLVTATDVTFALTGNLLETAGTALLNSSLVSSDPQGRPVMSFDPSTVTAASLVAIGPHSLLGVASPLLVSVSSSFSLTGDAIAVTGGTILGTTSQPLITLQGKHPDHAATLTTPGNLVSITAGGTVDIASTPRCTRWRTRCRASAPRRTVWPSRPTGPAPT